jgi:predicted phosphoadenosine phosphosulfate sulfurtransferase
MDYRRIYLPRWREWQEKTEAFLQSLPMVKAGPRTH